MNNYRNLVAFWIRLILLSPLVGLAQYHRYNVENNSDVVVQEYRSPNLPLGIYDAIHTDDVSSPDQGLGYFYGGLVHETNFNRTGMQFVCWPAATQSASGLIITLPQQQVPIFAGTNMVPFSQIAEGSSCAIKGYWPLFRTNLWSRFAMRCWQPADGTPRVGYQGMWMKDPVSAQWHHLGTFRYPFGLSGVNGMHGWQENFGGNTGDFIVEHAGGYYHKNGGWHSANEVVLEGAGYVRLVNGNTAVRSEVGPSYASQYNTPATLLMTGQPAQPTFDPIIVSSASANMFNAQLLVRWQLPPTSSPQLEYRIEVFNNPGFTGAPAVTRFNREPETRQELLAIPGVATPYVRLVLSDIFFQSKTNTITPAVATLSPAVNVAGTVGGLTYAYYEAAPSLEWTALPNFPALTAVLRGALSTPDPTPRRRRANYAFNYSGYFNAPANGLYAFTLRSGDGSKLIIDGTTVINFDGLHDSSQFMSGSIALAAGRHTFALQYFQGPTRAIKPDAYTDGLGLSYAGPGIAWTDVPAAAFSRVPAPNEPTITLTAPSQNATVLNSSPGLAATVSANGASIDRVLYYLTDYYSYYPRPSQGADYYLGQDASAPFAYHGMVWTAPTNAVRARLVYNSTNTIDSPAIQIATTNSALGAWIWSPLEFHNYPSGVSVQGGPISLIGDGMNFLSRRVTGDCTLIGRLLDITPDVAGPDGVAPDRTGVPVRTWRAGILLRSSTNVTIGTPLGDGVSNRFAALFSSVAGETHFQDDTMREGNNDANAWSPDLGGINRWYKLQRVGDVFLSSVSQNGVDWTLVNSVTLTDFGPTLYAGAFIHAAQSMNPNVHRATLELVNISGAIVGPSSVAISPIAQAVTRGLPATFTAQVIGPAPGGYQWRRNGAVIPNATNATYTVPAATANEVGTYTVTANALTSPPATLALDVTDGSGIWSNLAGGSWATSPNWSGGLIASGVDAAADFGTLSLNSSPTVSLDGAKTIGAVVFDDLNPVTKRGWTLTPGSGGSLRLATTRGTPYLTALAGSNVITAEVTGSQGLSKTGPGHLTLGQGAFAGTTLVQAGTLEVQNRANDGPYFLARGATLRLGYNTGGGYADTGLIITGDGAAATTGLYLQGGKSYNASGKIVLQSAPTTLRQYGTGLAGLGTFDVNVDGLWCQTAASGSALDPNIEIISRGYGMSVRVDNGANTTSGDLIINGRLNVGVAGFFKRGPGSLLLRGSATADHTALTIEGGSVLCGVTNCIGANATLHLANPASLQLRGFNQTAKSLTALAGSTIAFGGTNTLTVAQSPLLAGSLVMAVTKNTAPHHSRLSVPGSLTFGGTLTVVILGPNPLAAGDTFPLFSASAYAGSFSSVNLPALPAGLQWDTSALATAATLRISGPPAVTTRDATGITYNSATLNGLADPNGLPTTAFFQWGLTTSYGQTTPGVALGQNDGNVPFSRTLAGLTLDTTYHFRAVGSNSAGVIYGADRTFTPTCSSNLVVTSANDSGPCSLRLALAQICPGGTITFSPALHGQTIALTNGELVIDKNLTLVGPGADRLAVSGNFRSRVLSIASAVTTRISGLTITDGQVTSATEGGGILSLGRLTLAECDVRSNRVVFNGVRDANGGGIYQSFDYPLTIVDCVFHGNRALYGGGIYTHAPTTITNSTVSGNVASVFGGGILAQNTIALRHVTIVSNVNHGLELRDTARYHSCLFAFNSGGNIVEDSNGIGLSLGRNLSSDNTGHLVPVADQANVNPLLGPLADNGGPTLTHALLPGSPAIDGSSRSLPLAWQVSDVNSAAGSGSISYTRALTPVQRLQSTNRGWTYTIVSRLVDGSGGAGPAHYMIHGNGIRRFYVAWDTNASGQLVAVLGGNPMLTTNLAFAGAATNYHTHTLVYDPATQQATYSVDGLNLVTWPGLNDANQIGLVQWGSASSAGRGRMNYHHVKFDITGMGTAAEYLAGYQDSPLVAPHPTNQSWTASVPVVEGSVLSAPLSPDPVSLRPNEGNLAPPEFDQRGFARTSGRAADIGAFELQTSSVTPQFEGIEPTSAGPRLNLLAAPSEVLSLQRNSEPGFTGWQPLTSGATDASGRLQYIDTSVPGQAKRFYRAVRP